MAMPTRPGPASRSRMCPLRSPATYPSRFQPVHPGSCGVVTRRRADRLARSVHDRRSGAALAARRTAADRPGDRGRTDAVRRRRGGMPGARRWPHSARRANAEGALVRVAGDRGGWTDAPAPDRLAAQLGRRAIPARLRWRVASAALLKWPVVAAPVQRHQGRTTIPIAPSSTAASRIPPSLLGAHDGLGADRARVVECLAWWDFSAEIPTDRIIDRGPHGLHGHCATCRRGRCAARAGPAKRPTGGTRRGITRRSIFTRMISTIAAGKPISWSRFPTGMACGVYGIRLRCGDTRTSCRSTCCRRAALRRRQSSFWPRPSPTRSTATTGAAIPTTAFVLARLNGAPIRGMPTSTPNTAPRPTTRIRTAAASAIRACAGRC